MGCGGSKAAAPAAKAAGDKPQASQGAGAKANEKTPSDGGKSDGKSKGKQAIQNTPDGKARIVMGKYRMNNEKEAIMGEGTSSICRKGTNNDTAAVVAIKVYKEVAKSKGSDDVMMLKFRRQVEVLEELQQPFDRSAVQDPVLWHEALATVRPSSLFMLLIDYSKNEDGTAGSDPNDGVVYVITELAQYSLKDFLALQREQNRKLPVDSVKSIARAIILVVAGMHAKGLVHIDLKPENLMMFSGRLKLIDVDGCVKMGSNVSIQDSSISFSPCYCAPEWASFLTNESNSLICVQPCLDVWSIGITICELVQLSAILKPMYGNFLRNAHSHREAGFLFMDWLSSMKKVPLPKAIEKFDQGFIDLMRDWMLVPNSEKRKSCAQCLSNPYIASAVKKKEGKAGAEEEEKQEALPDDEVMRAHRARPVDDSTSAPLYKGRLWTLNTGGNPKDASHWVQRDMWLAQQGSLCYFSTKENKRLILIEGTKLVDAEIQPNSDGRTTITGSVEDAFQVKCKGEEGKFETFIMAAESEEERAEWEEKMKSGVRMDVPTMALGNHVQELRKFVISVKNKRQKISETDKEQFSPVYKELLWKLKADGDRNKPDDWFEREMWISKNGSLVYYSKKEERDLVYYTSADLMRAKYVIVPETESTKPFTFQVILPEVDGVEFAPGDFAANTEELRKRWLDEFQKGSEATQANAKEVKKK